MTSLEKPFYLNFISESKRPQPDVTALRFLHDVVTLLNPTTLKIGTMYNSMLRSFSRVASSKPGIGQEKARDQEVLLSSPDQVTSEEALQNQAQIQNISARIAELESQLKSANGGSGAPLSIETLGKQLAELKQQLGDFTESI